MTRRPDFSTRPDHSRHLKGRESLAAGVAAALLLWSGAVAWRAVSEARATEASLAALRLDVANARERLRVLDGRRRTGADRLTSQVVLTAEAGPGRVLAELAELLPLDVRLEGVHFDYGSRLELDVQVVARRPAGYDLFLERLQASPSFNEIQPGPEAREGEMRASLRMAHAGIR